MSTKHRSTRRRRRSERQDDARRVRATVAGAGRRTISLGDRIVPRELRDWLARLRLLEGVPFAYLVADALLLPPESIRFFYLDRAWTDALVQGALSVGTVNSADRAQLEQLYRQIRDEIDEEERLVRAPGGESRRRRGRPARSPGFLLRSRAVSGWPGCTCAPIAARSAADDEIIPESHPDRIKLLRLERLAPAVLLALFDGVPAVVHIEEPRQGVQFGVRLDPAGGANQFSAPRCRPRRGNVGRRRAAPADAGLVPAGRARRPGPAADARDVPAHGAGHQHGRRRSTAPSSRSR